MREKEEGDPHLMMQVVSSAIVNAYVVLPCGMRPEKFSVLTCSVLDLLRKLYSRIWGKMLGLYRLTAIQKKRCTISSKFHPMETLVRTRS